LILPNFLVSAAFGLHRAVDEAGFGGKRGRLLRA
jgi:hypothetical protein